MKQQARLSKPMYNLLISKNLDQFSITQARDELLKTSDRFDDVNEARKYVYRQVSRLTYKGYLAVKGQGRRKIYTKTDLFYRIQFTERRDRAESVLGHISQELGATGVSFDFSILEKERNQYHGELSISLAEVDEYKHLLARIPSKQRSLQNLMTDAKERSAALLGKINAITALLSTLADKDAEGC